MHKLVVIAEPTRAAHALCITLELAGHLAVPAHNGNGGLLLAQSIKPDMVLLDARLPGMLSPAELCRTLKARSPTLRVLLVGGAPAMASQVLDYGANGWLPLPFEPWELLAMVEHHLALRDERDALPA